MPRLVSPRPLALALAVVVALAVGACSEDGDVTQVRFQADLEERSGIDGDVAACLTDTIFADYDQAEINRIYRAATEDELGNERRDELVAINEQCFTAAGIQPGTTEPESGDDTTTTTLG